MNKPYRWWSESSPLNIGIFSYKATLGLDNGYYQDANMLWNSPYEAPNADAFAGDVIILVDRHTHSAAEDFTMLFKDNKRATIIGETTKGSTGQPFPYQHERGISFYIGTKKAYMPDGTKFEGVGISPDIYMELTREDLYNKYDRILEYAKGKVCLQR
ncbi:S41 family peptidase [Bacillus cytotoxicus]|uniref:S41 family peptidase n=1 Tax=Bacillus cytotoxicus TaxID=580165 RepID=A0ACC6ABP0_9BACI|nr:S41 family peptidase [Bacillus cytotoxicus]